MQQVGVIGMAVMGKNLALNIKHNGFSVSVFNITREETDDVASKYADENLLPTYSWEEFVKSLEKPRKIIMMIRAGKPVDETIEHLKPFLDIGDILIDGGNSYFRDTNRRHADFGRLGIKYIGLGVSGGEIGALNGPSMMPGGDSSSYAALSPMFEKIAAKNPDGIPCVAYIGPEGSGHYVKMIHNGIEYGMMQLICEIFDVLRKALGWNNKQIADQFEVWNSGDLQAYLISISSKVLRKKDNITGKDMVDVILNEASYKGTGNWMLEDAINLGAPISVIAAAVFARFMSTLAIKDHVLDDKPTLAKIDSDLVPAFGNALYLAQAVSYAQGFQQLKMASQAYDWSLNYSSIAQIWESGCIIRSKTLTDIRNAFNEKPQLDNLFLAPFFTALRLSHLSDLRLVVAKAGAFGIPVPAFSAALSYLESIFNSSLPANLLQAQRDYFGAHTYRRNDKPGIFHTEWYDEA
ncbi:NADP-dependent phosphogluconate dehydrogenase [Sporolactobacillus terrae]|uniref:NADP-dependent phosphogluconate dehydrogenase n=1 Tax=Sporolactobacillus terrae TaxID=269673 RepID=UPI00048E0BA6|nr:NADP-dependent phosphogluconate dehydrogenase [Sporolactobacillus terrae]